MGRRRRLVDPDVLRHLIAVRGAMGYRPRFPFAGARQAILASDAALTRLRELWQFNDEVWIHLGDADVLDTSNPSGGTRRVTAGAVRGRDQAEHGGGAEPAGAAGGGYAFSPQELRGRTEGRVGSWPITARSG